MMKCERWKKCGSIAWLVPWHFESRHVLAQGILRCPCPRCFTWSVCLQQINTQNTLHYGGSSDRWPSSNSQAGSARWKNRSSRSAPTGRPSLCGTSQSRWTDRGRRIERTNHREWTGQVHKLQRHARRYIVPVLKLLHTFFKFYCPRTNRLLWWLTWSPASSEVSYPVECF